MITLTDKEQSLLQAALMNLTVPDLAGVIDWEQVHIRTGHANKGVARTMFKRMMVKFESGDQPAKTSTTSKSKKRKADNLADKDDDEFVEGTKKSRAKAQPIDEGSNDESQDLKAKIKRERQSDALESE